MIFEAYVSKPIFYFNHDYSTLHCKESELHIYNKPMPDQCQTNARPISNKFSTSFLLVSYRFITSKL